MAKDGKFTVRIPLELARQLQEQLDQSPWGVTLTQYVIHHLRRLVIDGRTSMEKPDLRARSLNDSFTKGVGQPVLLAEVENVNDATVIHHDEPV